MGPALFCKTRCNRIFNRVSAGEAKLVSANTDGLLFIHMRSTANNALITQTVS